jgi:short-subunit dehydrogenase
MKNYALVTGASSGIGREIALQLAQAGYSLLLVSRNEAELAELGKLIVQKNGVKTAFLAIDLSLPDSAQQVADWCVKNEYPVDILANNAGYGLWGHFDHVELEGQVNMVNLNISTVVALTYLMLPVLKKASQAYVLNVASTAAYQAVPTLAVYAATKSFVLSFSRAISYELKDTNISVSCLCPGPTETGFARRAGMDALKDLAEKFNMPAAEVARKGIKGMFDKKKEIIPGTLNLISAKAVSFIPKRLVEKVSAGLYDKVLKKK